MEQGLLISCLDAADVFEAVRISHKIGYRNCEISVCPGDARPNLANLTPGQLTDVRKLVTDLGMTTTALQCHIHNGYGDASKKTRDEAVDHTKRMLDLAAGIEVDFVHTVSGVAEDDAPHAEQLDRVAECYQRILNAAGSDGPRVGIEPVFVYVVGNLAHTQGLYERLGDVPLLINFDPSHFPYHFESPVPFLETYADRIPYAHSKDALVTRITEGSTPEAGDADYPTADGEHMFRFAAPGKGMLDWDELIRALRRVGFDGVLTLEMGHGYEGDPTEIAAQTYAFFKDNYGLE